MKFFHQSQKMKIINLNRRKFLKFILVSTGILAIGKIFGLGFPSPVKAVWSPPTATPPGGNVPVPLNAGTANQVKAGALSLGGLVVDSPTLVVDAVNDRVGIGTTAPTERLQVVGTVLGTGVRATDRLRIPVGTNMFS